MIPHGVVWHKVCDSCAAEVLEATPWTRPCPFAPCAGLLRPLPFDLPKYHVTMDAPPVKEDAHGR